MNNLEIVVPVRVTYSSKHPPTSEPAIKILERTAVVDTGAHISVIREDIVDELNLRDIGRSVAVLASGEEIECKEFLITLIVSGASSGNRPEGSVSIMFEHVRVLAVSREQPSDLLIGMDILRHCHFTYNGPDHDWEFMYDCPREYSEQHNISLI